MNKSAVEPRLPLTATECGAYDFRMSNGQVLDVEEKESALCLGNAWTKVEQRVFSEKLADFACRPEEDALRKNFCTPLSSPPPLLPPPPTQPLFYSPTCADASVSLSLSALFLCLKQNRKCESFSIMGRVCAVSRG